jgi:hypothetical protein
MVLDHDAPPPPHWPHQIVYLTRSRLSPAFPASHRPFVELVTAPRPTLPAALVKIRPITEQGHPANGQNGLFASKKIKERSLIVPYLGVIHAKVAGEKSRHDDSDYDLSLMRLSVKSKDMPSVHKNVTGHDREPPAEDSYCVIDIGIDASTHGNVARMINDYRGIPGATRPNAEFRHAMTSSKVLLVGQTTIKPVSGMEVWSLEKPIAKGEEILLSYGKGFWNARQSS